MNSLQRDPNRYCASVYMPIDLAVKIKSEVEGIEVERKTRAIIHGNTRRKVRKPREKTIGDYLVEIAEKTTRKTVPTPKAIKWGKDILKRNLKARKEADAFMKAKSAKRR